MQGLFQERGRGAIDMSLLTKQGACLFLGIVLSISCALLAYAPVDNAAITPGSAQGAREYYVKISKDLGFDATPGTTTLDSLLVFMGYPAVAIEIERREPSVLMNLAQVTTPAGLSLPASGLGGAKLRDGDILAARFFAPKIANVSADAPVAGWRKLVRLRARPESPAARAGIESAVILFNFFAAAGTDPFAGPSVNTQVMLLAPMREPGLFWLDFDPNGKLSLALNASFDAALLPKGGPSTRDYFVPHGCNNCHGSPDGFGPPMINYLDTDHWFDRLDDDFAGVKAANIPVVFDAGTNDTSQPSFSKAFDVIRRFNEEALQQNNMVHHESFEAEAARTWLRIHADSDGHSPPIARAFSGPAGTSWQPSEADGLARLNRYCFRCHGSVRFSIFDRPTVLAEAGIMRQRIKPNAQQLKIAGFKMPPDRVLDPAEVKALDDFLKKLK